MRNDWTSHLEQWTAGGVIDEETRARIQSWEDAQMPSRRLRWPTIVALVFGSILLGAGILLFVSAHWDSLSPGERMTLVVSMVAVFHAGGAFVATRFEALSIALHTVGTISLGAAIALAGQIFNLSEHWPAAILLWAAGAALAWGLLRHWTQGALVAILVPSWVFGEFWWHWREPPTGSPDVVWAGACALSLMYLSARRGDEDGAMRKALAWIGGIGLLPFSVLLAIDRPWTVGAAIPEPEFQAFAWAIALAGPFGVAVALRRRDVLWNAAAIGWTVLLALPRSDSHDNLFMCLCCAVGAAGLTVWGIREARPERINLGIVGFALTVLCFYFSNLMDKLGRSASLIVLGLLVLAGGWALERMRRHLIGGIGKEAQ